MDTWHSGFAEYSPLLLPLRDVARRVGSVDWPSLPALQEIVARAGVCTASGLPLRLTSPAATQGASMPYEARLFEKGELEFREHNWHDLFNVLVWLTFPQAKAALNARHHAMLATPGEVATNRRGAVRDALTLFDESGIVVISADAELLRMVRGFQWKPLFWKRRAAVVDGMQFLLFGHALYEKALAPYKGMTGRGLLFEIERDFLDLPLPEQRARIDRYVSQRIADPRALQSTQELAPLPVLGVPGWCADNECAEYYDDRNHFRPGRRAVQPEVAGAIMKAEE